MNYEFKLTIQELAVIYDALGELPLKIAGPIFSKLQSQQMAQQNMQAQKEQAGDEHLSTK